MRTASPMSAAARAARAGRPRVEKAALSGLLGDDVLEGRPREYREDRVVQHEEEEESPAVRRDRGTNATDDERDRQGEDEEREQELSRASGGGHRCQQRSDHADPDVGEQDADNRGGVERREEERKRRKRDDLCCQQEGKRRERLRKPDRTAIAGGQD